MTDSLEGRGDDFALLAKMTARLASTASLEEIATIVTDEIVALGFGGVWVAELDEASGNLITVREIIEGRDTTGEMPRIHILDMRQPIGHGFRDGRMINIPDPAKLLVIEDHPGGIADGSMALPRVIHDHLRGNPFACGPLLGSRGQAVGALGLSSFRGRRPLPDGIFQQGMLAALMNHLGIAMERALHLRRLEHLNSELVQAHELLQAESRMKAVGELASAVAHDLNNLSGITLMAVHGARSGTEELRSALGRIDRANRAIGELTRRLQRVARTGSDPENRPVDLAQIVDDVVLLLQPLCREDRITIDQLIEDRTPVAGDATIIKQAVLNVMLNAREALVGAASDRRRIRVRLSSTAEGVALTVKDNGPGIPDHLIGEVFKPFVSSKTGHAGLGLAIAHSGMKHLGGTMEASNDPQGGACLRLSFLRTTVLGTKAEPSPASGSTGRLCVLAVDDEREFLIGVEATLRAAGHEVVTASDGDEAMARARDNHLDLVIIDLGLPGRNGLEIVGALRRAGVASKFILMTGWDTDTLQAAQRLSLCDRFLQKPFAVEDLKRMISEVAAEPRA
jgi:signal transduction histidine kinase/CheY-like chemotaxis protein